MGYVMLLNRNWIFFTLATLYLFSRFLRLDGDIPIGWDVAQYDQFDELLYSIPGLNLFHYGTWDIEPLGFRIPHNDPVFSIWNFAQFFLLSHLNNPLIALRIPSVIAGLLVYFMYLICLDQLKDWLKRAGCFNLLAYALFAIFPLIDLTFYLSNIINEPTIYRLMSASLIFLILLNINQITVRKALFLGVITASSVVFIYTYNAFLVVFVVLALFAQKRQRLKLIISFSVGLFLIFTLWLLLTYFVRGLTLFEVVANLAVQRPVNMQVQLYDYLIRLASVFATNFLIFSPILTILVVLSPSVLAALNLNKKLTLLVRKVSLLTILYLVSYAAQLMFVPDFPQRKGLVIYTPILIMAYLIATILTLGRVNYKKQYLFSLISIGVIGLFLSIYSVKLTKFIAYRGYFLLFTDSDAISFFYIGMYVVAIGGVAYLLYLQHDKYRKLIVITLLGSAILSNCYLVLKYCLINTDRTFSEMIADVRKIQPGYLVGNWSYGLSFANRDNKPLISPYYSKYLKDPDWGRSDNSLNLAAFNLFLESDLRPVYTIVKGRDQLSHILERFPSAKIRYSNTGFRDQTNYIDHYLIKRSVLIGDPSESDSNNEMYIIQLSTD